jgi:predicted methyltransferase
MNKVLYLLLTGTLLSSFVCTKAAADAHSIEDALKHSGRPSADLERDARSQPASVLGFFRLEPGDVMLDLFAGEGYYSEIGGYVVGDEGTVYAHNTAAYLGFAGKGLEERLAGNRLAHVQRYDRELDTIDLADDSVDLLLMVMTYHDLYYKADGWDLDAAQFFATAHRVLKPGGVLGIVDHAAMAGSGSAAAQELHRIAEDFARQDIEGHGFVFDGELDVLRNPDDQLATNVFDESVRFKTDRFVYRFVEPGG